MYKPFIPKKITAMSIFYNNLLKNKVKNVFIYSGGSIMPFIDTLYKSKDIKYFVNSHEQNCGHAATGYAKTSKRTGVAMVTSGPGITNLITPLLDAKNDSTPFVAFSGQVPIEAQGTNAFQEAPAVELTKNVTKWSYQVKNVNDLDDVMNEAFYVANNGKKGSVHIDLPKCLTTQKYTYSKSIIKSEIDTTSEIIDYKDILKVGKLIIKAQKPILYVGQGAIDDYNLIRELAIKCNIPVTTTIHGTGIFDEHHTLSLSWCGMHGSAAANFALQQSDLIIAIGSRFDDRTTGNIKYYAPEAFKAGKNKTGGIVHVNIEKKELNFVVNSHYNFNCSTKKFIDSVLPIVTFNKREAWITKITNLKKKYPFVYKTDNKKLHMEDVITELYQQTLKKKVIFTTGVGNHQMQAYQFIKSQYPKKIISSGSLGVMGTALPYAIGAKIANPEKLVVCLDGDSSFNMSLNDLKTVRENNLPIKIAIMNNEAQMMVTVWEKLFFEERYTATLNKMNPDYHSLAKSFGIPAFVCKDRSKLESSIHFFLNFEGPILCEFKIEKDICLPLVGPGKALDDMLLPDCQKKNVTDYKISGMAPS